MTATMRFEKWENSTATKNVTIDQIAGGSGSIPLPISPTSVTVAGGTGSINSMGVISFANATSITVDGFVTKPNTIYRIVIQDLTSTNNARFARFVKNGAIGTTGYYGASTFVAYATAIVTDQQKNNTVNGFCGYSGTYGSITEIELKTNSGGAMYKYSSYNIDRASYSNGGYSNIAVGNVTGIHFYFDAGNAGGTIQIFEDRSI